MYFTKIIIAIIFIIISYIIYQVFGQKQERDLPSFVTVKNLESPKKLVKRLNKIWNRLPYKYINNPLGYAQCFVFTHSFDCESYSDFSGAGEWNGICTKETKFPWCPKDKASLKDTGIPIKYGKVPIHGISFSAFNKYIRRPGKIMFGEGCGLLFEYETIGMNKQISPMCFFPTDAATLSRSGCGCKSFGIQSPASLSEKGYNFKNAKPNIFTKKAIHENSSGLIWWLYTILQPSLNFKQFVQTCKKEFPKSMSNNNISHNEVIIPSWLGVDFGTVPLVAFYVQKHDNNNILKMLNYAKLYKEKIGFQIPVVYFNPYTENNVPFEVVEDELFLKKNDY